MMPRRCKGCERIIRRRLTRCEPCQAAHEDAAWLADVRRNLRPLTPVAVVLVELIRAGQ